MNDLADKLAAVKTWCREQPVRLCVFFGSQATGQSTGHSDIDLAIWPTASLSTSDRLRWLRELEALLQSDVSLVIVSADLDPVLGMEICRQGRLIYERSPELWVHLRWQLWHAYNDSLPFRRAARQQLHNFAQEVQHGS